MTAPPPDAGPHSPAAQQNIVLDFEHGQVVITMRRALDIKPIRVGIPMLIWKNVALAIMQAETDEQIAAAASEPSRILVPGG